MQNLNCKGTRNSFFHFDNFMTVLKQILTQVIFNHYISYTSFVLTSVKILKDFRMRYVVCFPNITWTLNWLIQFISSICHFCILLNSLTRLVSQPLARIFVANNSIHEKNVCYSLVIRSLKSYRNYDDILNCIPSKSLKTFLF